jgi:hypothetical protein
MQKLDIPYYLELQRRLDELFLFVACHKDNFKTYSVKTENLFVDSCAFFDSLCQTYIRELKNSGYNFNKQTTIDKFDKKISGLEFFNITDYIQLFESDFVLSKKKLLFNVYIDSFHGNVMNANPGTISGYALQPFESWKNSKSTNWWKAYTKLKHNRMENIREATLENTINAMAATYIILALKNESDFKKGSISLELYDIFFPTFWEYKGRKTSSIITFK